MYDQALRVKIVLAALSVIGAGIILAVVFSLTRNPNVNVEFLSAPPDATITVDGREYGQGKYELEPGEYTATAQREGFEKLSQPITIANNLQQITFALFPVSDEAKKWANENSAVYAKIEAIAATAAQKDGEDFASKYPLTTKLPYDASFYAINYATNDRNANSIYIRIDTESAVGRQVAIEQIRDWGYEPADYDIVFSGLINPFDPKNQEVQGE